MVSTVQCSVIIYRCLCEGLNKIYFFCFHFLYVLALLVQLFNEDVDGDDDDYGNDDLVTNYDSTEELPNREEFGEDDEAIVQPNANAVAFEANLGANEVELDTDTTDEQYVYLPRETEHVVATYYQVDNKDLCYECTLTHCRRHGFKTYDSIYRHNVYLNAKARQVFEESKCNICSIGLARWLGRADCPVCKCSACDALGFGRCPPCQLVRTLRTITVKEHLFQQ